MPSRLYVGNLPYTIDENELLEIFKGAGYEASRPHIVIDRETNRSKGFGFIEVSSPDDAQHAVANLNGALVGGRDLRVAFATERTTGGGAPRSAASGTPRNGPRNGDTGGYNSGGGYSSGGGRPAAPAPPAFSPDKKKGGNRHRGGGERDDY